MSCNNTVVDDGAPPSTYMVEQLESDCYSSMQQAFSAWPFNHSPLANPSFREELLGNPSANPPLNAALMDTSRQHSFSIHDLIPDNPSGFLGHPPAAKQLHTASITHNIYPNDSVKHQLAESLQLHQNLQRQNAAIIISGLPNSDQYNRRCLNHNNAKYSSAQTNLRQEQSSTISDQAFNVSVASCELPMISLPNNINNNSNGSGSRKRKFPKVDISTNLQETSSSRTNTSSPSPSQTDFKSTVEDGKDGKGKKRLKSPDFNSSADDNQKSEIDGNMANNSGDSMDVEQRNNKPAVKPPDPSKSDYIHVRARRGQATDSHSLAERVRREKISERMKFLQDLVPGCSKVTGKAVMLDEIINYVQSLQRQVEFLAMKLAVLNPSLQDFNLDGYFHNEGISNNRRGSTIVLSANPEINTVGNLTILATPAGQLIQQQIQQRQIASPENINNNNNNIDSFGYSDTIPQVSQTWDDELQSLVQIGFGQGRHFQKFDPASNYENNFVISERNNHR